MFFDCIYNWNKNLDKKYKLAFWCTLLFGVLAHGIVLVNKLSFHDDVNCLYSVGATYTSGRWGLGILGDIYKKIFGANYSLPLINGFIALLCIAVVSCIIVHMFRVQEKIIVILISGLLVVIPVVTVTFAFIYTAPYYFFALMLLVLGVDLIVHYHNFINPIIGIFLISFCLGVYQAYFPVAVIMLLTYFIYQLIEQNDEWKVSLKKACIYVGSLLASMILYFAENKFFLKLKGLEMSDYQGLSDMGKLTPSLVLQGVKETYVQFFQSFRQNAFRMTPSVVLQKCILVIWICVAIILVFFFIKKVKGIWNKLFYFLTVLLIPLAVNIICVMVSNGNFVDIHPIMVYSFVFMYIFPLLLLDLFCRHGKAYRKVLAFNQGIITVCLLTVIAYYTVFDNIAYFKLTVVQKQTDMYYQTLISRIRTCAGYDDDIPVAFVGDMHIEDKSVSNVGPYFQNIVLHSAFGFSTPVDQLNTYSWFRYMSNRCGYNPICSAPEVEAQLRENEEVINMPAYPDDGFVKIIDGNIVVKLSNVLDN